MFAERSMSLKLRSMTFELRLMNFELSRWLCVGDIENQVHRLLRFWKESRSVRRWTSRTGMHSMERNTVIVFSAFVHYLNILESEVVGRFAYSYSTYAPLGPLDFLPLRDQVTWAVHNLPKKRRLWCCSGGSL